METNLRFKLAILGDSGVGKSSITSKYVHNTFDDYNPPTIGAAFLTKDIYLSNRTLKLEIWDTAGQERYRSLAPMYYRGAGAVIVVYDITNVESFASAKRWISEVRHNGQYIIALVGNKLDKAEKRKVDINDVKSYIEQEQFIHAEVSAKTGEGINDFFQLVAEKIPNSLEIPPSETLYLKSKKKSLWWWWC